MSNDATDTLVLPALNPARFGRVAVVMGGWSAERDVSLMSGQQVFDALVEAGVDARAVDAGRDVAQVLERGGFDRAFLILHGGAGEDGTVQATLDLAGIPYTGSGVLGCALSLDKVRAKAMVAAAGVPTPDSSTCESMSQAHRIGQQLGYPLVVKPTREGSSIGVTIVRDVDGLQAAWELASRYGHVLVERFVSGTEIAATVLQTASGPVALPLVSVQAASGFYDYDAKYLLDDTDYVCPAALDGASTRRIQALALNAFEVLDMRGWARIDFMLDDAQQPQFIEANTAPGMTAHSLVPMAAGAAGADFGQLCLAILATTLVDAEPLIDPARDGGEPNRRGAPSSSAELRS